MLPSSFGDCISLVRNAGKAVVEVKVNQVFGKFIVKHELLKVVYPVINTDYSRVQKSCLKSLAAILAFWS